MNEEPSNTELKITGEALDDFQAWINAGKPFAFGKALIKRYAKNNALKKYFHGRRETEKDAAYLELNLNVIFIKWMK